MNIEICTNIYALDDLKQKANKFCKDQGIDKESLLPDFRAAYEVFKGDKFLLYINILQGVGKQLAEHAKDGFVTPVVAEIMNNLYLSAALIEEVDRDAQFRNIVDNL